MQVSIIVPTYREEANLRLLVPRIAAVMETRWPASSRGREHEDEARSPASSGGGEHEDHPLKDTSSPQQRRDPAAPLYEILIVDDDSSDGTDLAVAELAAAHPVRLIVRTQNRDLSLAVLEGLRQARGELLVVMDADLSHPPEKIPELLAAVQQGAEFAIGSRFVSGGRTEDDWGGHRRLNSGVATLLARPLAPGIADPMSGFFALPRGVLERASRLDPIGYKIGLELICRCRCGRVAEVPIAFANRKLGASKLNLRQQSLYLVHLDRLYRSHRRGWGIIIRPLLWAMLAALAVTRLVTAGLRRRPSATGSSGSPATA